MQSRATSFTRWAREPDPKAAVEPARKGFDAWFEKHLNDMGVTDPIERVRRGALLRKAYFADLARKSAVARRLSGRSQAKRWIKRMVD
jgi:hypothetical protein